MKTGNLLPLGTVVYLNGGTLEIMIISRQPMLTINSEIVYFDYGGMSTITGLDPNQVVYFNHENVKEVIFHGYISSTEERIQSAFEEWRKSNPDIKKGKV